MKLTSAGKAAAILLVLALLPAECGRAVRLAPGTGDAGRQLPGTGGKEAGMPAEEGSSVTSGDTADNGVETTSSDTPGINSDKKGTVKEGTAENGAQASNGMDTFNGTDTLNEPSEAGKDGSGKPAGSGSPPGTGEPPGLKKAPPKVRALYLTGWTAGDSGKMKHYIELAKNTEINSYVIDIKDCDGYVGYESKVAAVRESGTWREKYKPGRVIEVLHENNIYVIGRLVAFKDPVYSARRPDMAIKNRSGGLWKDNDGLTWLDPYNRENWEYLVSIAREAVEIGFDEIQFDYVRFPGDGKRENMHFQSAGKEKYQVINEFLAYAKAQIPEVPISADVFAIILESPADTEGIGQYLEYIGKDIDYISPMAYPSHYAYGQIINKVRFEAPDLDPYGVVYNTLVKCRERISRVSGYKAKVRPYLQDFTASWLRPLNGKKMYQEYGAEQVKQQIKAVYDAGYDEWILWDSRNAYQEEALAREGDGGK